MPAKPKRPCNYPGCPELVEYGYCDRHRPQRERTERYAEYERERGTAAQRGYNAAWRRARLAFLREHPWCVMCEQEGRLRPAEVVDHIVPHKGDWRLFWDQSNWQALCKHHHDSKTAREDGGFGRK
jgi:5-methylcytosine-specific restriction protein A